MGTGKNTEGNSPVTARAVCLGFLLAGLVCLLEAYNDDCLGNTLLVGNHFPRCRSWRSWS